jgi:CheY-like chemotaxis protein
MARILVIDDSQQDRRLMAETLIAAGHEVREARDGAEGLAACRRSPPDLVITDIVMPEMEGIEMIRELPRTARHVPVLAVSDGVELYRRAARLLGAVASLPKPVDADELLDLLDDLLSRAGEGCCDEPGSGGRVSRTH